MILKKIILKLDVLFIFKNKIMSYFNHAFQKMFIGTKGNQTESVGPAPLPGAPGGKAGLNEGFITTNNVPTVEFAKDGATSNYDLGAGVFGFVDNTYKTVGLTPGQGGDPATWEGGCCPLTLVASSIKQYDKIGGFHGGYQETNKSKMINPKYVRKFYRVDPSAGNQQVVHIGNTYYTDAQGTDGCCKEFMCDETYTLRIRIKGEPALNYMNHDIHKDVSAYTGCCDDPDGVPNAVDSTIVFIEWAKQIMSDPNINPFVKVIVQDESDNLWFETAEDAVAAGWADTFTIENYQEQAHQSGKCAGMVILGAYLGTKFGECTFDRHDGYEYKPVKFFAQLVDMVGEPCTFEGLCFEEECPGYQPMGLGETVVRELILSESYLQNYVSGDARINEIMGGNNDPLKVVNKNNLYYRYYIQHSVPRHNNPTGTFDNDQYMLCIVTNAPSTAFEEFVTAWLGSCGDGCAALEIMQTGSCTPTDIPTEAEVNP